MSPFSYDGNRTQTHKTSFRWRSKQVQGESWEILIGSKPYQGNNQGHLLPLSKLTSLASCKSFHLYRRSTKVFVNTGGRPTLVCYHCSATPSIPLQVQFLWRYIKIVYVNHDRSSSTISICIDEELLSPSYLHLFQVSAVAPQYHGE